jgi:hypothetical protein
VEGGRQRNRLLDGGQRDLSLVGRAAGVGQHHDPHAARVRFGQQRLQPFRLVGQQGDLEGVVGAPERENRQRRAIRRQPDRADLPLLTRQFQRLQRTAQLHFVWRLVQA